MLRHYLITTMRTMVRNTRFLVIGVFGLSVALLAVVAILVTVSYERSFDKNHPELDNTYRLSISYVDKNGEYGEYAGVSNALGSLLQSEFPEVGNHTRVFPLLKAMRHCILSYQSEQEPVEFNVERMYGFDKGALDMFVFKPLLGDMQSMTESIDGLALSKSMARKYFGEENPIGKTMKLNGSMNLTVGLVFEDWPDTNHFIPEAFVWNDFVEKEKISRPYLHFLGGIHYTYLTLSPFTDAEKFESKLEEFVARHKRSQDYDDAKLHLMPLKDIHLQAAYLQGDMAQVTDSRTISLLLLLAGLILAIACFNYVNLSSSFALQRTKEILIRKVHGANKWVFFKQLLFISSAVFTIALLLALTVYQLQSGWLRQLLGQGDISHLLADRQLIVGSTLILACIILLTSFYPVTLLAAFKSSDLIKGKPIKSKKGQALSKFLIGLQFAITIGLLFGSLTVTFQIDHLKSVDTQVEMDDVLVVKGPGVITDLHPSFSEAISVFKNQLHTIPGVKNVATSDHVPGHPVRKTALLANPEIHTDSIHYVHRIFADEDFANTFELKLLAGRYFSAREMSQPIEQRPIVINASAAEDLGFNTAEDAIGKTVSYWNNPVKIIGVLSDFSMESLDKEVLPTFLFPSRDSKYFSIRLVRGQEATTTATIGEIFQKVYPGNPFDYFYAKANFDKQYKGFELTHKRLRLLGLLSVFLAGLGLFAGLQDMVRQRLKELCIRKVLGGGLVAILKSLATGYIRIVLLAAVICVPLLYLFLEEWLNQFANRMSMGWMLFVLPIIGTLMLTLLIILSQSVKAFKLNPVDLLRSE